VDRATPTAAKLQDELELFAYCRWIKPTVMKFIVW